MLLFLFSDHLQSKELELTANKPMRFIFPFRGVEEGSLMFFTVVTKLC